MLDSLDVLKGTPPYRSRGLQRGRMPLCPPGGDQQNVRQISGQLDVRIEWGVDGEGEVSSMADGCPLLCNLM
jgi:hypothetical protein